MVNKIVDAHGHTWLISSRRGRVDVTLTSGVTGHSVHLEFGPAGAEGLALALMFHGVRAATGEAERRAAL